MKMEELMKSALELSKELVKNIEEDLAEMEKDAVNNKADDHVEKFPDVVRTPKAVTEAIPNPDNAAPTPPKAKKEAKKHPYAPEGYHPALLIYASDNDVDVEDFVVTKRSKYVTKNDNTVTLLAFALAKEYANLFGDGSLETAHEYMMNILTLPMTMAMEAAGKMVKR